MPLVSVIVPCYNEQATIRLLLEALYQQDYPRRNIEVIISDGRSTDKTLDEIKAFDHENPGLIIRVVENIHRTIPTGLNAAIAAACGDYIIRLDAHSVPRPDYISRCITNLEAGLGENVGGVWEIKPAQPGWVPRSIAAAATLPLAVGDAFYRFTQTPQQVDTVPFGAFRRSLIQRIGGFDETLLTNEDYEFNVRVRQSGGVIWLDPSIRSTYFSRSTFTDLARQYWRYGFWKARMLIRYPSTLRWRQALPPLFVSTLAILAVLALGLPLARWALLLIIPIYLLVLLLVSAQAAIKNQDIFLLIGIPLSIATMHISWGSAFLWSWLVYPFSKNRQARVIQ